MLALCKVRWSRPVSVSSGVRGWPLSILLLVLSTGGQVSTLLVFEGCRNTGRSSTLVGMRCRLALVAGLGLCEFILIDGARIGWFLLEHDEAYALGGLIEQLDPRLEVLGLADVCGLVGCVTGTPPQGERACSPQPPA